MVNLNRLTLLWIIFCIVLAACQPTPNDQTPPDTEISLTTARVGQTTASPTFAPANKSTATAIPTIASSPTTSPAPTITPGDPNDELRSALLKLIETAEWQQSGISVERRNAWRRFAEKKGILPNAELHVVKGFINEWQALSLLITDRKFSPSDALPSLRLYEYQDASGKDWLGLYVIDEKTSQEDGTKRPFLIAHDKTGQAKGLVLAPWIAGFSQRPSSAGQFIEYFDAKNEWIIRADARWLDPSSRRQRSTKELLDRLDPSGDYQTTSMYPRYFFNINNIRSGFYALESLTYHQILLLRDTISLYDQGILAELASEVFAAGDEVEYVISREPHRIAAAQAWPMGGSPRNGIVMLYAQNLFNNRYSTAAALAHEATHIWQGPGPGCDSPSQMIQNEIGDRTIPSGFFEWNGSDLVQAARRGEIGAYHVDFWILLQLKQTQEAEWTRRVIQTGTADGWSLINCP